LSIERLVLQLPAELSELVIRPAVSDDCGAVLSLFDQAIAWFQTFGNTKQWGTEPFSAQKKQVDRVTTWLMQPGAWIAELPSLGPVGVIMLGEKHEHIPAAAESELYVRVLLGSRAPEAKGVGRALLRFADTEAARLGESYLRVDCYNGGSGRLPEFYESCGYRRTEVFMVGDWPGQILERRLDHAG
jgi:GNAT superfamily N-acetyltransferase